MNIDSSIRGTMWIECCEGPIFWGNVGLTIRTENLGSVAKLLH